MTKWRLISASENPARLVLTAFTALIVAGTALLRIPAAFDGTQPSLLDSLFTSTSATTVTGLATLNISEFSALGEVIILILIQVGGFGIMALGAILSVVASHRMGLHQRKLATAEFGTLDNGVLAEIDLRGILRRVAEITILVELVLGFILFLRLWTGGYENFARSLYSALFHSISSFNNTWISLSSDSLERFSSDPFLRIPMSAAFILGGFGFPIIIEVMVLWSDHPIASFSEKLRSVGVTSLCRVESSVFVISTSPTALLPVRNESSRSTRVLVVAPEINR